MSTHNQKPIDRLLEIMARLRDPHNGCPWDLEQDFKSIAPYTIEEAYEVADAIERNDVNDLKEELGDLLLQIVFHAQMASEEKQFTFDDVVKGINHKLVFRHPHVFGDQTAATPEEVIVLWDAKKKEEKAKEGQSAIDGVTLGLPSLLRAQKLQKKAAKTGFVWRDTDAAWKKVEEELMEFKTAETPEQKAEELGDLMFCIANYARMSGLDAESILSNTNKKFESLFKGMERVLDQDNVSFEDSTLDQKLDAWKRGKAV
jgi:ATP diphosphatase